MKRLMWVLPCVAVVLFAFSTLQAKSVATSQSTSAPAKDKVVLTGYWGSMAGELNLSDEIKAKIQDKIQPLQDWDKANKAKIEEIGKQMKDAKDAEAKAKLADKSAELVQERENLMEKVKVEVLALLSSEQRVQWRAIELYNGQARRFSKLELTEAQVKQAKEISVTYAKQILALKSPDDKALKEIRAAYVKEVAAKVLTAEQRSKFEAATSKPASTEKKK
jgi:Spy/CpxP family protein refolding chaperone